MANKSIYLITVFQDYYSEDDDSLDIDEKLSVGFYDNFDEADKVVCSNSGWDSNNRYAIIEEVEPGIHPESVPIQLYQYARKKHAYEPIPMPQAFVNLPGIGIW